MDENTNIVRRRPAAGRALDEMDRKLLTLLAEDATRSYAELGAELHLSAPAVHERVRRLRAAGVIRANVAKLDGAALGRPLLAFVHVDTMGWGKTAAMLALTARPEVEEIHAVTGDTCMLLKIRTHDTQALEELLQYIYAVEGVTGTVSYVVLNSYLERGPMP